MPFRLLETHATEWTPIKLKPTLNVRVDARLVPSPANPDGAAGFCHLHYSPAQNALVLFFVSCCLLSPPALQVCHIVKLLCQYSEKINTWCLKRSNLACGSFVQHSDVNDKAIEEVLAAACRRAAGLCACSCAGWLFWGDRAKSTAGSPHSPWLGPLAGAAMLNYIESIQSGAQDHAFSLGVPMDVHNPGA